MTDHLLLFVTIALAGLVAVIVLGVVAVRALRRRETQAADKQLLELARLQTETAVRIEAMRDMIAGRQAELHRAVNERLDSVTHHLNQSMTTTREHTVESLQRLNERLAVIDNAQRNIADLASQMTSLQSLLANKQQRGAFGQSRMELIVQDGLPKDCYEFQLTLSNKCRPDCAVFLPDRRPLTIDAKFPLEAVTAWREAKTEDERKQAASRMRQDLTKHVDDIAAKYLIAGETQDLALMFVPSESIFAELHDGFDDIMQKAFRSRVVIVSPSLLMLAIQVVQQIQKDARMREAADEIHAEVGHLMDDLKRLHERVLKLQQHFGQANEDVRQILVSAEKIERRGARIREVEFDGEDAAADQAVIPAPLPRRLQAGE
ncbi:MAG: DNA recombination protein RmuC [Alphaproteobacteria bacterium]|nr:MAG: DNA recombination protein RmuC [Alphaproteobacteria bacterium]TMJ71682.1 MAG: DNA recombination protein RmuC [Alphaproteobacteria bacterium]TMK00676.1 MAG: DNA recombination protein RmuC [Alphaproteobacteria bacterium]